MAQPLFYQIGKRTGYSKNTLGIAVQKTAVNRRSGCGEIALPEMVI